MEPARVIQLTAQTRILVAIEPADFRCGIDGLARLARERLSSDPFSGYVFVCRNRRGTAINILAYDGQGFCYVDVGDGLAAYGAGNFYAYPGPRVTLENPSVEGRKAKQAYEDLLDTWFDS